MDRRILVILKKDDFSGQLARALSRSGRHIKVSHDGTTALELLVEGQFSAAVLELDLPDVAGLDLIREVAQRQLPVSLVVVCEENDQARAGEAVALGAYDYLTLPLDYDRLECVIDQAIHDQELRAELEALSARLTLQTSAGPFIARGARMRELLASVNKLARTSRNVTILGESGTGRTELARLIHHQVWREPTLCESIHCADLPDAIVEKELGAWLERVGGHRHATRDQHAADNGGTLILEEIHALSPSIQPSVIQLLRALSRDRDAHAPREYPRARLIATAVGNLDDYAESHGIRRELVDQLRGVVFEIPPLRERDPDDLLALITRTLDSLARQGYPECKLAPEVMACLVEYPWPGNVRELDDVIEQLVVTSTTNTIMTDVLPTRLSTVRDESRLLHYDVARPLPDQKDELVERIESLYLRRVLAKYDGRVDRTATHCGLSRRSLSDKLRRYQIDKDLYKPAKGARRRSK